MHSVRPIAPTSIGRWRENLPRIKAQQELHGSLTPDLIECGYDPVPVKPAPTHEEARRRYDLALRMQKAKRE